MRYERMIAGYSVERGSMGARERGSMSVWEYECMGDWVFSFPARYSHTPKRPHALASIPPLLSLVLFLLAILAPVAAQAQDVFMTKSGHAEFTSSVPLHTFTGESDHLVGRIDLSDSTVDFYLDLATLETGIGKRDKDMRETLEVDEYPFAEFFGTLVSSFDPSSREPQPATVRGEFTLHGVTRTVEIDGTLQRTDEGLRVEAEWEINIEDYDLEPPGLLIVRVDEVQDVRIEAVLEPVEESS